MDKIAITEAVIKELKSSICPKQALKRWWYPDYSNNTENARLTNIGLKAISKVMTPHHFHYDYAATGNNIKKLSALRTPFFVDKDGIIIFSEQLATMIKMYPSFERYMELINK